MMPTMAALNANRIDQFGEITVCITAMNCGVDAFHGQTNVTSLVFSP